MVLYVREESEGTMQLASLLALAPLSATCLTSHKWIVLLQVLIPGGWACVCSRTLWVSPTNFPVRLGVSPTVAIPIGFYSQRF